MITGARYMAEQFEAYGVTHVFFVPTMLMKTLHEVEERTDIARVMTHGEKAAAYMADGYARVSGRPGICVAQAVGAANLASGLRDAWLQNSPVLALTGGPFLRTRSLKQYQEADDRPAFEALTKFSTRVDTVERIPDLLRQAFRVATSGRPGPVHIEFAGHLAMEIECETADLEVSTDTRFAATPAFRPAAEPSAVAAVLRALAAAERPMIVAGNGVRVSDARSQLRQLAERLAIPVVTSSSGKDAIPADHPLALGVVGLYSRESANQALSEADLVFYIGSPAGSLVTFNFDLPVPGAAQIIQLDIDPEQLGRHYENEVSLLGDARTVLTQMLDELQLEGGEMRERDAWIARVTEIDAEWRSGFGSSVDSDSVPVRPERLCGELSSFLPSNAILVVDTGHSSMWAAGLIDLKSPDQRYVRAAGSLGWGLPASLGAKCAAPDRPVVLFTGDGGLWYHLSEIETAVRRNLGIVVVVNDNRSLNQEVPIVLQTYETDELRGNHSDLWKFTDVDFAKVGEALGAHGMRVTKPGEVRGALEGALEIAETQSRPVVVDVATDIEAMAPPHWPHKFRPMTVD